MGKNYNPADAHRKAQKARELKKNAAERKRKREDRTAKQDTRELEGEIAYLKSQAKLSEDGAARLAKLESELKYVSKLKDKYVAAHPEARERVYNAGRRRPDDDEENEGPKPDPMAHLYKADGTLRDPKRSFYYDPTYNPFGVPPPGMPYRERSPGSDEESSDDSDDDSDSDIVMPEGPPPESDSDAESDDSLDIPLPEGPPPPRPPPPMPHGRGPRPPHFRPAPYPQRGRPHGGRGGGPGGPAVPHDPTNPGGWGHLMPSGPQPPPARPSALPARPASLPPPPSSLPAKPGTAPAAVVEKPAAPAPAPVATAPVAAAAVTISAEPQLRDLRKESTVFVPRGVARAKKAPGGLAPVNAAPKAGPVDAEGDTVRVRHAAGPGLMGKLSGVLGAPAGKDQEAEDEYDRFLEGLE